MENWSAFLRNRKTEIPIHSCVWNGVCECDSFSKLRHQKSAAQYDCDWTWQRRLEKDNKSCFFFVWNCGEHVTQQFPNRLRHHIHLNNIQIKSVWDLYGVRWMCVGCGCTACVPRPRISHVRLWCGTWKTKSENIRFKQNTTKEREREWVKQHTKRRCRGKIPNAKRSFRLIRAPEQIRFAQCDEDMNVIALSSTSNKTKITDTMSVKSTLACHSFVLSIFRFWTVLVARDGVMPVAATTPKQIKFY